MSGWIAEGSRWEPAEAADWAWEADCRRPFQTQNQRDFETDGLEEESQSVCDWVTDSWRPREDREAVQGERAGHGEGVTRPHLPPFSRGRLESSGVRVLLPGLHGKTSGVPEETAGEETETEGPRGTSVHIQTTNQCHFWCHHWANSKQTTWEPCRQGWLMVQQRSKEKGSNVRTPCRETRILRFPTQNQHSISKASRRLNLPRPSWTMREVYSLIQSS